MEERHWTWDSNGFSKSARRGFLLLDVGCRSRIAAHIFSKINYSYSETEHAEWAFCKSLPYNSID
jgi:hypothetical protein